MNGPTQPALHKPPGLRDSGGAVRVAAPRHPQPQKNRMAAPPPTYRPKKKRGCSCRGLCYCCCCVFIPIVLIVLITSGGAFYVLFDPQLPVFHLKSVEFQKFNVSVSPDGTHLDSKTDVRFEIRNPNKELKMIFDTATVTLFVESANLGSARIPKFVQPKKNITLLKFSTSVSNLLLDDGAATKMAVGYRTKNLAVSTDVKTGIGFGVGGVDAGPMPIKISCGGVTLREIDDGASPKCTVNILKWININL